MIWRIGTPIWVLEAGPALPACAARPEVWSPTSVTSHRENAIWSQRLTFPLPKTTVILRRAHCVGFHLVLVGVHQNNNPPTLDTLKPEQSCLDYSLELQASQNLMARLEIQTRNLAKRHGQRAMFASSVPAYCNDFAVCFPS